MRGVDGGKTIVEWYLRVAGSTAVILRIPGERWDPALAREDDPGDFPPIGSREVDKKRKQPLAGNQERKQRESAKLRFP